MSKILVKTGQFNSDGSCVGTAEPGPKNLFVHT